MMEEREGIRDNSRKIKDDGVEAMVEERGGGWNGGGEISEYGEGIMHGGKKRS